MKIPRRRFIISAAQLGGVALLTGCPNNPPNGQVTINIFATGTLDVERAGWEVLKKDLSREGLTVNVNFQDNGNDVGPVINSMSRGSALRDYQIGGLQGGAEKELAQQKLIAPWDMKMIPNWQYVWPKARQIESTRHGGEQYSIPIVLNADSIIFLPDRVGNISSYRQFFYPDEPERLRGRVAMEDSWLNSVIFAALYLKENNVQSINDPSNLTEGELESLMKWLIDRKKDLKMRLWNGWNQGASFVRDQEVWMMTGWEPIVYEARKHGVNAHYAQPEEGYDGWYNGLVLHAPAAGDAKLREVCHSVANWMLGGFYSCTMAIRRGYMVPARTCPQYIENNPSSGIELSAYERVYETVNEKITKSNIYWQNVRPEIYQKYDEWWTKLRAA